MTSFNHALPGHPQDELAELLEQLNEDDVRPAASCSSSRAAADRRRRDDRS